MKKSSAAEVIPIELNDKLNLNHERRSHRRFQVMNLSELVLDINGRTIACMVHDLSEVGALIESGSKKLPNCFVLSVPDQQLRVLCRKVWSQGTMTGVAFMKSGKQAD